MNYRLIINVFSREMQGQLVPKTFATNKKL